MAGPERKWQVQKAHVTIVHVDHILMRDQLDFILDA